VGPEDYIPIEVARAFRQSGFTRSHEPDTRATALHLAREVAKALSNEISGFDTDKFLDACGVYKHER
jgi:hypothetical protein